MNTQYMLGLFPELYRISNMHILLANWEVKQENIHMDVVFKWMSKVFEMLLLVAFNIHSHCSQSGLELTKEDHEFLSKYDKMWLQSLLV